VTFHHNFTSIENLIFFQQNMFASLLNKKNFFFQKEKADLEKLKLILKPEEMSATVNLQTPHERMQHLEQVYQELEAHYKKTIERIAAT